MARKVRTTNEQPAQSTVLVEVTVERKTVLVASSGNSKTGCRVVHVDCADAWKAARRDRQKMVVKAMAARLILSSGAALEKRRIGVENVAINICIPSEGNDALNMHEPPYSYTVTSVYIGGRR